MPPHLNSPSVSDCSDNYTDSIASYDFSDANTESFVVTENLRNTPSTSVLVLSDDLEESSIDESIVMLSSRCTHKESNDPKNVNMDETAESLNVDNTPTEVASHVSVSERSVVPENSSPANVTGDSTTDTSREQLEQCENENSSIRAVHRGGKTLRMFHDDRDENIVKVEQSFSRKHSRIVSTIGFLVVIACLWISLPSSKNSRCKFVVDEYLMSKYKNEIPPLFNRMNERRKRYRQKKLERRNRRKSVGKYYSEPQFMETKTHLDPKKEALKDGAVDSDTASMNNEIIIDLIRKVEKLQQSILPYSTDEINRIPQYLKPEHGLDMASHGDLDDSKQRGTAQIPFESEEENRSKPSSDSEPEETLPVVPSVISSPLSREDLDKSKDEKCSSSSDTDHIDEPQRSGNVCSCETHKSSLKYESNDDLINLHAARKRIDPQREQGKRSSRTRFDKNNGTPDEKLVRADLSNLGYVPVLLLVDMWSNDANDVFFAIQALVMLLKGTEAETLQTIRIIHKEIGGFAIVVGALRKWYDNEKIQEVGLEFLRIALQSDWSVFQQSARSTDAVHVVLITMNNFRDNEYIQQAGCGALNSLTRTTGDYSKKLVTTELEIIDIILEAIKAFPTNSMIRRYVCKTLYKMSRWDVLRKPIHKKGGTRILKKALKMKNNDEETKNFAMYALRRLDK